MIDLFEKGGPLMWPLLVCSVLSLGIIIERAVAFLKVRRDDDSLLAQIDEALEDGDLEAARRACQQVGGPIAAVLEAGLSQARASREVVREQMEAVSAREIAALERYSTVLATIANVAPLLGFLGTVWGMILAFEAIAAAGLGNPKVVAGGISQALITTASGLAVAIPTFIGYNYFMGRADAYALRMEQMAHHLLHRLEEVSPETHAVEAYSTG